MLSKNRLLLNQTFLTRDSQGTIHTNTQHTYESGKAMFDIDIIDGKIFYGKNCRHITDINTSDKKYFDFIQTNISAS